MDQKTFNPQTFHDSVYPIALRNLRFIFCAIAIGNVIWGFVAGAKTYFIYLTDWGITITMLYFILASLSYYKKSLMPYAYILFETIWPLECGITILYWTLVAPFSTIDFYRSPFVHILPFMTLLCDFLLNRVIFLRKHYKYFLIINLVYTLGVNLPYTLAVADVYPMMNYKNAFTYISATVAFIVEISALEIGLRIKRCQLASKKSQNYEMNDGLIKADESV